MDKVPMPDKPQHEHIVMPERKPGDDLRDLLMRQLRASGGDPSQLLDLIELAVESRVWEARGFSFAEFIATPYAQGGLGWSVDNLRGILRLEHRHESANSKIKARMRLLRQEVERLLSPPANKRGRPKKKNAKNADNISISRSSHGTGRLSTLAHLQRDQPELAEKVLSGEMSANEAAIVAGFRKRSIQVYPDDLDRTLAALKRHFDAEALAILARALLDSDG